MKLEEFPYPKIKSGLFFIITFQRPAYSLKELSEKVTKKVTKKVTEKITEKVVGKGGRKRLEDGLVDRLVDRLVDGLVERWKIRAVFIMTQLRHYYDIKELKESITIKIQNKIFKFI